MPTLEDLHAMLLQGVQPVRDAPGPPPPPFLVGYGAAIVDLTTLLCETALWTEPRLDMDVLARAVQIRNRLPQSGQAPPEPPAMPAPVPQPERALGAGAASGGGP